MDSSNSEATITSSPKTSRSILDANIYWAGARESKWLLMTEYADSKIFNCRRKSSLRHTLLSWRDRESSQSQVWTFTLFFYFILSTETNMDISVNLLYPEKAYADLLNSNRLGWYRQDWPSQGTPPSIHRLVLRPCRLDRSSCLPPQDCRCWSSAQSPRLNPQPWLPPIPPRQCLRFRRPQSHASTREDRCPWARWGEGRKTYYTGWTTWFGPYENPWEHRSKAFSNIFAGIAQTTVETEEDEDDE